MRRRSALALVVFLGGCAWISALAPRSFVLPRFDAEDVFANKPTTTFHITTPDSARRAPGVVIGEVRTHGIRAGETFFEVARYYDVGYNEIVEANPGVDPLVPPVGTRVVVPTQWILPCCTYRGIVMNVPEMRLYFYRSAPGDPGMTLVETYPVGVGRDGWPTPRGKFRVRGKTINPRWIIPESIREEHIRERGDARRSIPGGAPDNPLGRYRIELSLPLFSIHGTDIPWGIGMKVTHGCVRLYPEDIEGLFARVPIGMPVEFTDQPVKVGRRDGTVYVEVHRDIYRTTRPSYRRVAAALLRQGIVDGVDAGLLRTALERPSGVPVRISRGNDPRRAS